MAGPLFSASFPQDSWPRLEDVLGEVLVDGLGLGVETDAVVEGADEGASSTSSGRGWARRLRGFRVEEGSGAGSSWTRSGVPKTARESCDIHCRAISASPTWVTQAPWRMERKAPTMTMVSGP